MREKSRKNLANIENLPLQLFQLFPNFLCHSKFVSYLYSQILALNKGMLLHGAAVAKDKKVFLFLGISGSGKSTVAALSRKYKVLGDDVIGIRKCGKYYYAFQTPWKQQPFIKVQQRLRGKIAAIFFLKKSSLVSFKPLPAEEAFVRLLATHIHFLIYTDKTLLRKVFFTAADFSKNIPAYEMEFRKNKDFWKKLEKEICAN